GASAAASWRFDRRRSRPPAGHGPAQRRPRGVAGVATTASRGVARGAAALAECGQDASGDVCVREPTLPDSPERRLLRAVMGQALCDALGRHGITGRPLRKARPHVAEDACAWLASEDTAAWSFRWACEVLT